MPSGLELLTLGRTLKQAQYKHHRALDTRLRTIGVSLTQWDALRAVADAPELSGHALAQATFQTDQAFSTLARRLEERGWIRRTTGPGNLVRHSLTPEGRDVLVRGRRLAIEVLATSFGGFSAEEKAQLLSLLDRIVAAE